MSPQDAVAMVVLVCGGAEVANWPLSLPGRPSLAVVDELARLQLAARRLGCAIRLRDVSLELSELLYVAGVADVVASESVEGSAYRRRT